MESGQLNLELVMLESVTWWMDEAVIGRSYRCGSAGR